MKPKNYSFIGASYFAGLGTVNAGMTLYNNLFGISDALLLAIAFLPLFIRKKWLSVVFGLLAAAFSVIIGISCLMFQMDPLVRTPPSNFIMGYLLSFSMLGAALMFVGAALGVSEKGKFSLV